MEQRRLVGTLRIVLVLLGPLASLTKTDFFSSDKKKKKKVMTTWQKAFIQIQERLLSSLSYSPHIPINTSHMMVVLPPPPPPPRAIIWMCDDTTLCGGLADRIRGIVLMMFLAAVSGRAFFIHHRFPVPLETTLMPRNIAWNTLPLSPNTICQHESYHHRRHDYYPDPPICCCYPSSHPFNTTKMNTNTTISLCKQSVHKFNLPNSKNKDGSTAGNTAATTTTTMFEKAFHSMDNLLASNHPDITTYMDIDTSRSRPWPTTYLEQFPWHKNVIIVRSNSIVPMYRPYFLAELCQFVTKILVPNSSKAPHNNDDDVLVKQLLQGLKKIKPGQAMRAGIHFLFQKTPIVQHTLYYKLLQLFHHTIQQHTTTSNRALFCKLLDRIITDDDHDDDDDDDIMMEPPGDDVVPTDGSSSSPKIVGVHLRMVQDGTTTQQIDVGTARMTVWYFRGLMECVKRFCERQDWSELDGIKYMVISDSIAGKQALQLYFPELVLVDLSHTIYHVDLDCRLGGRPPQPLTTTWRTTSATNNEKKNLDDDDDDDDHDHDDIKKVKLFTDTLADVLLLSITDGLVLTPSGFGELSAAFGNIHENRIGRYWMDVYNDRGTNNPLNNFQCLLPEEDYSFDICLDHLPCWNNP